MKKRIVYGLMPLIMVLSIGGTPAVVLARDDNSSSDVVAEDTSNSTDSSGDDSSQEPNTDPTEIKTRLEKAKTELKIKLEKSEELKLKAKCKSAQGVIKSIEIRLDKGKSNRQQGYAKLVEKLNNIVARLKLKNIDTTALESQMTELNVLIQTYKTALEDYLQAVSDAHNIDCTTDPTAFKAGLEAARAKREAVAQAAAAIKSYVKSTIKPTLQALRAQLEAQENESSTN